MGDWFLYAGTLNAGAPDAGTPDAGVPDAGVPDAGMRGPGEGESHRGPLSTESLARGILAKQIAEDAWVAPATWFEPPGASGWRRAREVPEIVHALAVLTTGDLRLVEGAFTSNRLGSPEFGATVMMVGSARRTPPDEE